MNKLAGYDLIHCLEDFGMIAGSYKVLYIDCVTTEGAALDLSTTTEYGCRFVYYGTTEPAFSIVGESISEVPGRMKITIPSSMTVDYGDCVLEYIPYVKMDGQTIKYGKGRLVIEGDATWS